MLMRIRADVPPMPLNNSASLQYYAQHSEKGGIEEGACARMQTRPAGFLWLSAPI
jgi:hypothetical protein